jgi:hypothetical protein
MIDDAQLGSASADIPQSWNGSGNAHRAADHVTIAQTKLVLAVALNVRVWWPSHGRIPHDQAYIPLARESKSPFGSRPDLASVLQENPEKRQ